MSEVEQWLPHAAFAASGLVQGIGGFGGSLVAMALLPLVWPVPRAVGVSAVFGIVLTAALAVQLRGQMQRAEIVPLVAAAIVGVPIGIYALHSLDAGVVLALLGAILLLHGGWSLLDRRARAPIGRWAAALAGFAAGALSGAFSTAGPPVLVYATARGWAKDHFRANLQAFFLSTSALSLVGFVLTDIVTAETALANLALLPALLIGGGIGHLLSARIDAERFRRGVLVALVLMGANYLLRAAR